MAEKKCCVCEIIKPLSAFYKHNGSRDGVGYRCRECHCKETKVYRIKNPDKIKEVNKICYQNKREERVLKQREWSRNNKDKIAAAKKRRLAANPEYNRRFTLKKYGITESDFNDMWIRQFGSCWTCNKKFTKKSDAHIDHCHNSLVVRGLL